MYKLLSSTCDLCMYRTVRTYLPTHRTCTSTGTLRTYRTTQYCTYLPFAYPSFFLLHKLRFWNSNDNTLKRKPPSYQMNISNNIYTLHSLSRHQNRPTRSTPKSDCLSVNSPGKPSFNTIFDLQWQRATNNNNICAQNPIT